MGLNCIFQHECVSSEFGCFRTNWYNQFLILRVISYLTKLLIIMFTKNSAFSWKKHILIWKGILHVIQSVLFMMTWVNELLECCFIGEINLVCGNPVAGNKRFYSVVKLLKLPVSAACKLSYNNPLQTSPDWYNPTHCPTIKQFPLFVYFHTSCFSCFFRKKKI